MDDNQKLKYDKSKYILKKWESEFKKTWDKLPSKPDIKSAPKKIKEAYKTYWTLKRYGSSSQQTTCNIHEDENAKDCFNSSSETAEVDVPLKDETNKVNTPNILEDSVCFQAVSDALTQSRFSTSSLTQGNDISQQQFGKSESFNENTFKGNGFNSYANELTPTSFKDLFNKENRSSASEPIIIEDVKSKRLEEIDARIRLEAKSISCQYAEKLFAGSKFNKRNPRKSRSFQNPKKTKASAADNSTTLTAAGCSGVSKTSSEVELGFTQEISELPAFPKCPLLNNGTDEELPMLGFSDKFKIVSETPLLSSKTVNLLQQSFENSIISKPAITRTIDKGWLERISESYAINDKKVESNLAESQDSGIGSMKTDSVSDSISNVIDSQPKPIINNDSDDDVIYSSDCETQGSLGKLNLLENFNRSNISLRDISINPKSSDMFPVSSLTSSSISGIIEAKTTGNNATIAQSQDMRTIANKRYLFEDDADEVPFVKRLKSDDQAAFRSTTKPEIIIPYKTFKKKSKTEDGNLTRKQELLEKKLASGDANKNFVKINIEKKKYARGKKTMTFSKYKKQKWKDMRKNNSEGGNGVLKCYRCGDVGHFSKACPKQNDTLVPLEEYDSADDCPFPTLEEAAEMAKEAAEKAHKYGRKFTKPEESSNVIEIPEIDEPPCFSSNIQPLYKLSPDGSLIETPKEVYSALNELGHDRFRPGQEKGIMRILSGLSTVVTLSTGSGKSMIYQLPAFMYNKANPGCITLVISPLVSLMEDQIFCGSKKLHAVCLHHNMTQKKRETVLEALKNRSVSVLLIAPESLSSWDSAKSLFKILPPIAFACIDEAHSISQHSHNFRPSYLTICQVLKEKIGISTLLGLTATASATTLQTIMSELGIDDASSIISDIPLPDNLNLSVSSEFDRREALLTLLNSERFSECDSIIIYCTRREECDKISAFLRASLQETTGANKRGRLSIHAEAYHAGLTAGRRNQVQSAFMSGKLRIVVATVAFGMGINKSDIRGIIHYNMPYSFESYVQEVGRAGRDKKPAHCHLFLDSNKNDLDELKRHIYADAMDRHTIRKLLQLVFVPCKCAKKSSSENANNVDDTCSKPPEAERTPCSKHEVAFPIEDTVTLLDLPQEVISTLLAYLQLDKEKWIKVLPLAYTKCKVQSYKGAKHLKKVARGCPPLAIIMAEESSSSDKALIEFDIVKLARDINWDSGTIKNYLKQLEWTTIDGNPKKSGILVEFSCLGFRVLAPGNLSDAKLDLALDLLYSKVKNQEEMRIKQLSLFYDLLLKVAHDNVKECCDKIDQDKCDELKTEIRKYFCSTNPLAGVEIPVEEIEDVVEVASDIRRLIATYRSDNNFTGRNIARILHGIGSPNFPPIVWGRTKFWRLHLDKDFNSLVTLANKQLVLMR